MAISPRLFLVPKAHTRLGSERDRSKLIIFYYCDICKRWFTLKIWFKNKDTETKKVMMENWEGLLNPS